MTIDKAIFVIALWKNLMWEEEQGIPCRIEGGIVAWILALDEESQSLINRYDNAEVFHHECVGDQKSFDAFHAWLESENPSTETLFPQFGFKPVEDR